MVMQPVHVLAVKFDKRTSHILPDLQKIMFAVVLADLETGVFLGANSTSFYFLCFEFTSASRRFASSLDILHQRSLLWLMLLSYAIIY